MEWLYTALAAYTILAVVNVADKFILKNVFPNSRSYALMVSILGMLLFLLAPWFLSWPGIILLLGNLIVGALFLTALLLMYGALQKGEVSKVIVLIGGSVPVFTLVLSLMLLGERFAYRQWWAIALLMVGTVMISWLPKSHELWTRVRSWFKLGAEDYWHGISLAVASGLLFALFFVGTKFLFQRQEFFSAFIWMRLGTFLAGLGLLSEKSTRQAFAKSLHKLNWHKKSVFFSTQILAGIGNVLQNYAISIGSVVLVAALQGFQFATLLVISSIITLVMPSIIKEKISKFIIFQKAAAIALISLGLYFVASS